MLDTPIERAFHAVGARRTASGLLLLGALLAPLAGCGPGALLITPVPARQDLEERVLARESIWAIDKIALVDVDGVLANQRDSSLLGPPGENPVALFTEKLDRAARDPRVKAIVLRINSPGGGVTASDLMYTELRRFRDVTGKPIIACMLDLAASGGYYIACAADRIYAHPTTVTGSIGVIMIAPDLTGTMTKLGIRANVIKSGELKDAGSPFREMNERDRALFTKLIDSMYERFLEVVAQGRPQLAADRLRELADGRVFLGPEARELGLVDEIGTLPNAVAAAKHAARIDRSKILLVEYARPLAHRANYYSETPLGPAQVNLVNVTLPPGLTAASPQFMYLWAPTW